MPETPEIGSPELVCRIQASFGGMLLNLRIDRQWIKQKSCIVVGAKCITAKGIGPTEVYLALVVSCQQRSIEADFALEGSRQISASLSSA